MKASDNRGYFLTDAVVTLVSTRQWSNSLKVPRSHYNLVA